MIDGGCSLKILALASLSVSSLDVERYVKAAERLVGLLMEDEEDEGVTVVAVIVLDDGLELVD